MLLQEVNTLLITNFGELDSVLNKLLHSKYSIIYCFCPCINHIYRALTPPGWCFAESGEIVKDKLGEISKAAVLVNLTTIVQGLKTIRSDLGNIDSLTKALQHRAKALEIGQYCRISIFSVEVLFILDISSEYYLNTINRHCIMLISFFLSTMQYNDKLWLLAVILERSTQPNKTSFTYRCREDKNNAY